MFLPLLELEPVMRKDPTDTEITAALQGRVPAQPIPFHYRLGLILAATVMLVLPLLYVGLIGLVGYGLFWHLTTAHAIFDGIRGRGALLAAVVYVGPIVAGVILILFMFKPLLARPPKVAEPRALDRNREPLLFAFVERLCAVVGSPMPSEIRVDSQVNASAGFRRGLLSLFTNDLVLTVGMPLAAGLTLRQLAGVLAHEFGHFSQAAGMRLTFVVRTVSYWFVRVVYERDALDLWLIRTSEAIDIRIGIVLYLARGCVWCTRWILKALMYIGHGVSSFLLRQMEFDADSYETHLAGSDTFEQTAIRLTELNIYMQGVQQDLTAAFREGRLPDDLTVSLLGQPGQLDTKVVEEIKAGQLETKTGWLDTHPADRDRIAAAKANAQSGLFTIAAPATRLFDDFPSLARLVTQDYYQETMDKDELSKIEMVCAEQELGRQEIEVQATRALEQLTAGQSNVMRPLVFSSACPVASEDAPADQQRWQELGTNLEKLAEAYREKAEAFDESDTRILQTRQAEVLLRAGYTIEHGDFQLQEASVKGAEDARQLAHSTQQELDADLSPFEELVRDRLKLGMALLFHPEHRDHEFDGQSLAQQLLAWWPSLCRVSSLMPELVQLRNAMSSVMLLAQQFGDSDVTQMAFDTVLEKTQDILPMLHAIEAQLGDEKYVLGVGKTAGITLQQYIFPAPLPSEGSDMDGGDISKVLDPASDALDKLYNLYYRLLGRIALASQPLQEVLTADPGDGSAA
jgi:Zn-dependent protease with chaperone function